MIDSMVVAAIEQDCNDIKTGGLVVLTVSAQPGEGGFADLPLFERGYRKLRDAEGQGFAAFDLYKDKGATIPGNDVDLAPFAAKVPLDNPQAVSLQKGDGKLLSPVSDPGVLPTLTQGSGGGGLAGVFICPSHEST